MFSKHFFKNIQLTGFTIRNNYRMSEEIRLEMTKSKYLNLQMRKMRLT